MVPLLMCDQIFYLLTIITIMTVRSFNYFIELLYKRSANILQCVYFLFLV